MPDNTGFDFHGALRDWYDFERTDRKVIARRRLNGRLPTSERLAMEAARGLLDEGLISIITKPTRDALGRPTITFIAERVK